MLLNQSHQFWRAVASLSVRHHQPAKTWRFCCSNHRCTSRPHLDRIQRRARGNSLLHNSLPIDRGAMTSDNPIVFVAYEAKEWKLLDLLLLTTVRSILFERGGKYG
jgi:hypothetical protein